jgi:hypothetical protein
MNNDAEKAQIRTKDLKGLQETNLLHHEAGHRKH